MKICYGMYDNMEIRHDHLIYDPVTMIWSIKTFYKCSSYMNGHEYLHEQNRYLTSQISLFTWSRHNCLVIVTSSGIICDIISRLKTEWARHGDNVCRSSFISSFMYLLCHVRNRIMDVLLWQILSALTLVIFWCLFILLLFYKAHMFINPQYVYSQ